MWVGTSLPLAVPLCRKSWQHPVKFNPKIFSFELIDRKKIKNSYPLASFPQKSINSKGWPRATTRSWEVNSSISPGRQGPKHLSHCGSPRDLESPRGCTVNRLEGRQASQRLNHTYQTPAPPKKCLM